MTVAHALGKVRYVVDSAGQKTDAIIPLAAWEALLGAWQRALRQIEDKEDIALLETWLKKREAGEAEMISLDELEQELTADGLL